MGRHTTPEYETPTPQRVAKKTHTTGATYAPANKTNTPGPYAKAPRRASTYPSLATSPAPSKPDKPNTSQAPTKATSDTSTHTTPISSTEKRTPITKKTTQPNKKKTNPQKKNLPKLPKLSNELISPSLLVALIILLLGIILTGFSWGWIYAGAVALVTLGFITAYTIMYFKTN